LWQIFTATKHFFLNKMATYRQNNIFDFLGDTEGDPEVVTKEASKKQEPVKAASQTKAPPGKKQDSPPKPSDKNQPQAQNKNQPQTQNKKPDNQPNKAKQGGDKQGPPRGNNTPANKGQSGNNTKPLAAPVVDSADSESFEKPVGGSKQRSFEPMKHDRKNRTGYDNDIKKSGEGRYNWGRQGEEYRNTRRPRREFDEEPAGAATEENTEPAKSGEAVPAEAADATKPSAPKDPEDNYKSVAEYEEEQKAKAKFAVKLPEIRKAGEGEEDKWKDTIKLVKKEEKNDVYMQAAEIEQKKVSGQSTEKDNKSKKGQVLEINIKLPRIEKPRENKRSDSGSPGGKRGGNFKKSGPSSNAPTAAISLDEKSFPKLQNTA